MTFNPKFYRCEICGQVISVLNDEGIDLVCCGQDMTLLKPNSSDGAGEKHVPAITVDGDKLRADIGSVAHPMTEGHHIEWVYLLQENGGQRRILDPAAAPCAIFDISQGKPVAVFAYCNLHGLWVAEL